MSSVDFVRMQVRLPSDVDAWLKTRAKEDSRSKNSMLVTLLREAMRRETNENAPLVAASRGV
ncbi:MAG: Arc family DNA-binding protein [Gammaproteobacteria bacterium]|nr:Arc family DNA-binding protein [Gammaproteobacteria bacterium]